MLLNASAVYRVFICKTIPVLDVLKDALIAQETHVLNASQGISSHPTFLELFFAKRNALGSVTPVMLLLGSVPHVLPTTFFCREMPG